MNFRKIYHTLRQKIICEIKPILTEKETIKNPFGKRYAQRITKYCAKTGDYLYEEFFAKDFSQIKKDLEQLTE